jgi:AcrR family transcriptional regulator
MIRSQPMTMPPDTDSSAAAPSAPLPLRGRDSAATKQRLLDAAEALFADRGFEGTSMRAVTQAAGVSVSAANYHFGSKEALLRATLWRVIEPVNKARFELLDALEAAAPGPAPLPLESVLDAFLRPALAGRRAPGMGPARYRQVAARLFSDPPDLVSSLKREYFGELIERFVAALRRALPGRPDDELRTALEFTVAVMVHVISGQLQIWYRAPHEETQPALLDGNADAELDDEEVLRRMIRYAAAGLRAIPASAQEPGRTAASPERRDG